MKGKEEEKRNKKWSASKAAGRMGGGDGDVRGDTTMCASFILRGAIKEHLPMESSICLSSSHK